MNRHIIYLSVGLGVVLMGCAWTFYAADPYTVTEHVTWGFFMGFANALVVCGFIGLFLEKEES